jgi:hypothetical protein
LWRTMDGASEVRLESIHSEGDSGAGQMRD